MDSAVITEIITQWGLSGLVLLGAAYILWDNYKSNKDRNNLDINNIFDKFSEITNEKINLLKEESDLKFEELSKQIESIFNQLNKNPEDIYDLESKKMALLTNIGPTIHSILSTSLNNCNADHIFLAIFHNGATGITGIPYIKFDVIAEKFLPMENPEDHELIRYYKGEDILHHNKLGSVLIQHSVSSFDLSEDILKEIDSVEYKRCRDLGIKHISYIGIRDNKSRIAGFLGAYSFSEPLNESEFEECAENIENVYKSISL